MTDHLPTDQDLISLDERLTDARERSAKLAAEASTRAREFVHDHPVATMAGGIAIGVMIAGVLARRRTPKVERQASDLMHEAQAASEAAAAKLMKLAEFGVELATAYVSQAASAGKQGVNRVESTVSDASAESARKVAGVAAMALSAMRDGLSNLRKTRLED